MWDRARLNLMLHYGGRQVGSNGGQNPSNGGSAAPFVGGTPGI